MPPPPAWTPPPPPARRTSARGWPAARGPHTRQPAAPSLSHRPASGRLAGRSHTAGTSGSRRRCRSAVRQSRTSRCHPPLARSPRHSTGRDGYRRLIDRDLDLAGTLAARVREHPSLELDAAGLSVVCFRYRAAEESDRVQSDIARRIQLGGRSFLTTTELDGRTVLRACFINPLTTELDVDTLVDLVTSIGDTTVIPDQIGRA